MRKLRVGGEGKRTIAGLKAAKGGLRFNSPLQIWRLIHSGEWPYKRNKEYYHLRDRALAALLYLTSGRINEVLRLSRDQFSTDEEDKDILVCHSFYVSKRSLGGIKKVKILRGHDAEGIPIYEIIEKVRQPSPHPTPDIPLPRVGRLSAFTKLVEDYLVELGEKDKLFEFGSSRALAIVDVLTGGSVPPKGEEGKSGMFNHWFRAQSFSYQVNTIRSTIAVAADRGVENPATLAGYYTGSWREHISDIKK